MQYIKHLTTAVIFLLFLASCEKVIEVDLNSASPKFVIEGMVTDGDGPQQVRITRTKNFDENNTFEGIDSAEVIIADDEGNNAILSYYGNGIYQTADLSGVPGNTYYLSVNIEEQIFTAESTMPHPVELDSLYIQEFTAFGNSRNIPTVLYSDPAGIRNFYRHILYVNYTRVLSIYINTDQGNDGEQVERPLPYFGEDEEERIKAGDTITVKMQSIGKDVYDYLFSLNQTLTQSVATPANPVSNITGDALGYFSAYSVRTETIQVE